MLPSKRIWCLVWAFFGALVWAFVDRSFAVDTAYAERDLEFGEYFYDPSVVAPDMLQFQPATDGRHWAYEQLEAGDPKDDESLEFVEIHIEYFEYVVAPGDSLWQLQDRFGVRFELIYELNRLTIDRNFSRRCGEPSGMRYVSTAHCSSPEATLQKGMLLNIPTNIWLAPIDSALM